MIRFGIIGAGGIATKFASDIKFVQNAKLVAVASRTHKKAIAFKEKFNIEYAFESYEEMAKSDLIDAVYVAIPHNFHKEVSIMCMNHKKHVLCEKPIAVNAEEFEEMVISSKKNEVLLMEAMWTKFLPVTKKVREVVISNELGALKHTYLEFGQNITGLGGDVGRWFNFNLAGGSLLDMGVYPIAYTLNLTEIPVKSIKAKAQFYHTGIDTVCEVDIVFEDDSTATLVSSFLETKNKPGIIEFEKGTIIVDDFWESQRVSINGKVYDYPHIGQGFPYQIEAFSDTIEKGLLENDLMTHDQTRKSMELLDRIREIIGLKYPFE